MSKWHLVKKEDIDIDLKVENDCINIYVCSDIDGSIYCELKIKDILEKLKENNLI